MRDRALSLACSVLSAAVAAALLRWWMDVPAALAAGEAAAVTALLAGWALWTRFNAVESATVLVVLGVLIAAGARLASARWPAAADGLAFLWIAYPAAAANAVALAGRARRSDYHVWLARVFDPVRQRERRLEDPSVHRAITRHARRRQRREGKSG